VSVRSLAFDKVHILFAALVASILVPGHVSLESPTAFLVFSIAVEIAVIQQQLKHQSGHKASDIGSFFYVLLLVWELSVTKFALVRTIILPPPEQVFNVYVKDWKLLSKSVLSSTIVLIAGVVPALVVGNALGLVVGWHSKVREIINPIAKVLNAVPAIIYVPYVILILPALSLTIAFVLFWGIFLGTFINMIYEVGTVNKAYVDAARTLTVKPRTMLFRVILPASLPGIVGRMTVSVSTSFIILIGAEQVGASSGIAYYIAAATPLSDFAKELAAIFALCALVILSQYGLKRLESRLLYWVR
jgi:NitT/TauT family transport system permease protein